MGPGRRDEQPCQLAGLLACAGWLRSPLLIFAIGPGERCEDLEREFRLSQLVRFLGRLTHQCTGRLFRRIWIRAYQHSALWTVACTFYPNVWNWCRLWAFRAVVFAASRLRIDVRYTSAALRDLGSRKLKCAYHRKRSR